MNNNWLMFVWPKRSQVVVSSFSYSVPFITFFAVNRTTDRYIHTHIHRKNSSFFFRCNAQLIKRPINAWSCISFKTLFWCIFSACVYLIHSNGFILWCKKKSIYWEKKVHHRMKTEWTWYSDSHSIYFMYVRICIRY